MSEEQVAVRMRGGPKMLWGCLGIPTLGMIPLLMWATTFRRWPRTLDREGLTLRSGRRFRWTELTRGSVFTMVDRAGRRLTGRLDLYFGDVHVPIAVDQIEEPERVVDFIRTAAGKDFDEPATTPAAAGVAAAPRRREETTRARALLNATGFVLILLGIAAALWPFYANSRYTAKTQGLLDRQYSEIRTEKKKGNRVVADYLTYRVSYRFNASGATFTGTDEIGDRPTTLQVTVYFDPSNPARNRLVQRGNWNPNVSGFSLVGLLLGLLVLLRRRLFPN